MNLKYKAVMWDFDGTIADTAPGIFASVRYAAKEMNLEVPEEKELEYFIGPTLPVSFNHIFGLDEEGCILAVKKYREFYVAGGMFMLEFYKGIIETLDELKKNDIKIIICSNKPKRFVKAIAEHYGFLDKIDMISCPDNDNQHLTKADMILNGLKEFSISAENALMVGDRYLDMEGAVKAGVDACGAEYGYGTEEELLSSGAKYIAHSVEDVRKLVFSQHAEK